MVARACPLCASPSPSPFLELHGYSVLACRQCGLRFLDPHPTAEQLTELYGESYFANARPGEPGYDRYLEEIENIRRTFDDRLRSLPQAKPGAKLLDLGAAIGLFVERARAAGWDAEGLEMSAWAAKYARDVLGQPVRTGTLEAAGPPEASTDVVTLWEVIEHLPDPRATLTSIASVLKPGGLLALSTPDAGSRVARILGRRWLGWTKIPEHLFFFDRSNLTRLLGETGFSIELMRYVPLIVSRRYLLDRVGQIIGFAPHRGLSPGWLDRPVRVNPYYDLMVLARRK